MGSAWGGRWGLVGGRLFVARGKGTNIHPCLHPSPEGCLAPPEMDPPFLKGDEEKKQLQQWESFFPLGMKTSKNNLRKF